MDRNVIGAKGGDTSSTATEAPDTLSSTAYAQMLDVLTEGPAYGPAINGSIAQSTFLDGTPIQNADGTTNFTLSSGGLDYRLGTLDQTYIAGFDSSASENSVGVSLKASTPWVHTVENLELNAIRITLSVNSLSQTNQKTGDVSGYTVNYQIQLSIDDGAYAAVVDTAFSGKASSTYTRSHRIELAGAKSHYTLRVVRTTPDATSDYIQANTNVVGYTELIDAKFRYPYTALVALSVDASQFSSVPNRSYDWKGLLIKIPTNYDPIARTYSGPWDGTFVTAWSDNPAWVFYDLVLNARYGLGQWVDATQVDRYALYTIAQYCDELVPDGAGGLEPRFTCNCYIQARADAYKVLQDLASIFRGMAYWSAGGVVATADMPLDPAYVYAPANVIDGTFKYVGSSRKTRYTAAVVTWNNPDNGYQQEPEYVEDPDGVARYGLNKAELTAFGCTSRTQAQRVGQWAILTSRYESDTVTFSVGLDGAIAQPGQIIEIADPIRAGVRNGGRISSVQAINKVTVDSLSASTAVGDSLTLVLPTGKTDKRTISALQGDTATVSQPFSVMPVAGSMWVSESSQINAQTFRVSTVTEKDGISFEIAATQHNASKYPAIDNGAAVDVLPISGSTLTVQQPPTNVRASQYVVIDQGIAKTNMTIAWDSVSGAVAYAVQWRRNGGDWVTAGSYIGGLSVDVANIYTGSYLVRVKAINVMGIASAYALSTSTPLQGKTGAPPVVATLTASTNQVFSIGVNWSFPPGAEDTDYTEIYYAHTADFTTATPLGRFSYPTTTTQLLGLVAGYQMFFWARLVDKSGNVGPWYPSDSNAGVAGMSSADASSILGYLSGQISATQLAQDLVSKFDYLDGIQQTVEQTAANLSTETEARIDGDSALSSRIDKVEATYLVPEFAGDPDEYAGVETSYAGVWSEQDARAEADLALATRLDTTTAQITTNNALLLAAVQTEATARATADQAQASQITTVQSQVADNSAAVQTVAQSYTTLAGQVSASYQVKTQVTVGGVTYVAGIGLGIDNSSGTVQSQFLVTADRFAIINDTNSSTTKLTSPFVIQGGQVFINTALIGTGYITNAMIGDTIQSTAVNDLGQPSWVISKSGGITLNGPAGYGYQRLTISGNQLCVYDSNNTLRVRLGLW